MQTVNLYYPESLVAIIVGALVFVFVKTIIELIP
jgi:hypothetical protein